MTTNAPYPRSDSASTSPPSDNGIHRLVAVGVVVLVAIALVVLLVSRVFHATQQAALLPGEGTTAAPDFTMTMWNTPVGQGFYGTTAIHLADLRGHVVVVNFWAPWCEPCMTEAPVLSAAARRFSRDGVAFIGVAFQANQSDSLAFVRKYSIPYPVGLAPDGLDVKYGVTGLPYTFVIAPDGTLAYTFAGTVHADTLAAAIGSVEARERIREPSRTYPL
jgi:cytochrome c biogenesis protein CcmG, thiol:disulfide interchange protein DsbE